MSLSQLNTLSQLQSEIDCRNETRQRRLKIKDIVLVFVVVKADKDDGDDADIDVRDSDLRDSWAR